MKVPILALVLVFPILFAVEQRPLSAGEIIHEDFDDGNFGDGQPGHWVKDCPFSCGPNVGILDASSGDLVMDTTNNDGFMWAAELRSLNGEWLHRREGWSIRTLMTLDAGARAGPGLGWPTLGYAGLEWFGEQRGGGLIVGQRQLRNTVYFDNKDPIYGNEFYVQLDAFDGLLTGYAWGADDPSRIISTTFGGVTSGALPVVWNQDAASTFKEVIISTTPIPLPEDSLLGDMNGDAAVNGLDVDPFTAVLLASQYDVAADMNGDEAVNGLDVDPFVAAVVGGGTQQIPEPSTLLLAVVALGVVGGWRRRTGGVTMTILFPVGLSVLSGARLAPLCFKRYAPRHGCGAVE